MKSDIQIKLISYLIGRILADTVRDYMQVMKVENGLNALGYNKEDIPSMITGTLAQVYISTYEYVFKFLLINYCIFSIALQNWHLGNKRKKT